MSKPINLVSIQETFFKSFFANKNFLTKSKAPIHIKRIQPLFSFEEVVLTAEDIIGYKSMNEILSNDVPTQNELFENFVLIQDNHGDTLLSSETTQSKYLQNSESLFLETMQLASEQTLKLYEMTVKTAMEHLLLFLKTDFLKADSEVFQIPKIKIETMVVTNDLTMNVYSKEGEWIESTTGAFEITKDKISFKPSKTKDLRYAITLPSNNDLTNIELLDCWETSEFNFKIRDFTNQKITDLKKLNFDANRVWEVPPHQEPINKIPTPKMKGL